jgi:hypothetical protein
MAENPIDRHQLVSRHNVEITKLDSAVPLQVGNGHFAFGMDVTGLQTFVPFNTMSDWGWGSFPPPAGQTEKDFQGQIWDTHGRPIRYPMPDPNHPELSDWLAGNPHRVNIGRIGFLLKKADGSVVMPQDLKSVHQSLDLWTGVVNSKFELEGVPVSVRTACDSRQDAVTVEVNSELVREKRLAVFFSRPGDDSRQFANFVGDWSHPCPVYPDTAPGDHRASLRFGTEESPVGYMGIRWDGQATIDKPKPDGKLKILSAEYGAAGHWVNVLDEVTAKVDQTGLTIHVDNNLAPDPALGTEKTLRVVYASGGVAQSVEAGENEDLVIANGAENERVTLTPSSDSSRFAFTCTFSSGKPTRELPTPESAFRASQKYWPEFWKSGGAIDLSGSRDPRWKELERRIVLSQYLLAVNEAGNDPPQESGLVNNGWFGRWHMEMFWWHAAQWAVWNRWSLLDRALPIYSQLLPKAEQRAASEGYEGARWPKCIGPNFREWPHEIHSLLVWQQPHPIFFAELDYRAHPTKETLKKWWPVVNATADFLSTYAFFDQATNRYVLGPPMVIVSENTNARTTMNPTFELSYWRFGLRTALDWRKRLGIPPDAHWQDVLQKLSPLPQEDGVYVTYEGIPDMWTKFNFEHPGLTGVFGILPGDGVDKPTFQRTLDRVRAKWTFSRTWGWDYPMLAMAAARLGHPDEAIDFLLTDSPNFQFDVRGLATGGPFPYFPSNGGLLYAVAMMAAGWDGHPHGNAPGFPGGGSWHVRWEGLSQVP